MKVIIWSRYAGPALSQRLQSVQQISIVSVQSVIELAQQIDDGNVLVIAGADYTAQVADLLRDRAANLRLIQLLTAGFEKLELHGVPPQIVVANAGDSWSPAVADHVMALMLDGVYRRSADGAPVFVDVPGAARTRAARASQGRSSALDRPGKPPGASASKDALGGCDRPSTCASRTLELAEPKNVSVAD